MRLRKSALGLLLPCVLSLACSTFCEEYPEACTPLEGGAGGTGPTGPFDVTVALLDADGLPVPLQPLLVSDAEGEQVEVLDTGVSGKATVTLPDNGYYVSLFQTDGSYRFTALAARGPAINFRLPPPPHVESQLIVVDADCPVQCLTKSELSLSCGENVMMTLDPGDSGHMSTTLAYAPCPSSGDYDAFIVSYEPDGDAVYVASKSVLFPGGNALLTMSGLDPSERFDLTLTVPNNQEQVTRSVRVPATSGFGYGFNRSLTSAESKERFSLVTELVPRAQATFLFAFPDLRSVWNQQLFDPVAPGTTATFERDSLAIPKSPPEVGESVSYSLSGGPIGDAIQLVIGDGTNFWVVNLPAAESGSVPLPKLKGVVESFVLGPVKSLDILHIDIVDAPDYAGFAERIRDFSTDTGLDDLTRTKSRRLF